MPLLVWRDESIITAYRMNSLCQEGIQDTEHTKAILKIYLKVSKESFT